MGKAKTPASTPVSGIDYLLDQETHLDLKKPWMDSKQFILGTTGNIATIMDECIASGRYALDLETTGLDNRVKARDSGRYQTVDTISGVCLSPDGVKGYYIPLHHRVETGVGDFRDHEANIPLSLFDPEFRRLLRATEEGKTVAVFHNGKFDQEFLQFNETGIPWGEWDRHAVWEDTMILAYLRNTRARRKGLKALSATPAEAGPEHMCGGPGLGMEMIDLHELWGHPKEKKGFPYNFSTLDPTDDACLWYACSDAICTWLLYDVLKGAALDNDSDGRNQAKIYQIEKVCVAATRWMERNRIHIDRKKVLELIILGQQEWMDAIMEVYNEASKLLGRDVMPVKYVYLREHFKPSESGNLLYQQLERATINTAKIPDPTPLEINGKPCPAIYDVNSQQQLGQMFDELQVPGLKYTEKSGQVVTRKVEIDRIIEEAGDQFPFMGKVRRFREVSKALSTYLFPMMEDSDPEDDTMRINFQGHKTDTGRFSTPAKESISGDQGRNRVIGWPQVNVQSTPKHTTDTSSKGRPACMGRLRECYTVRPSKPGKPPKFLAAIDYGGVELRLVTNLSREIKWLSEFFHCAECDRTFERVGRPATAEIATQTPLPPPARCPNCGGDRIGDLHTLTGISIYGQEAPTKPNWKDLRGHSKALNFALCYGGGGQAAQRAVGVDKNEGQRLKRQFDQTYLTLSTWWKKQHQFAKKHGFVRTAFSRKYPVPDINSPDGGFRSKAERNSVNGPVQGSSADVTKTAMALIYKEMKQRGWLDKVMMTITMHDELVFEIDGDVLEEALGLLVNLMTANRFVLGMNWPIPLTTDVEIGYDWTVPWDTNKMRYGETRFNGNAKVKKPKNAADLINGQPWDTLPTWPEDLRPWFKGLPVPVQPVAPVVGPSPAAPVSPEAAPVATEAPAPNKTEVVAVVLPQTAPGVEFVSVEAGGDFVFQLGVPLSLAIIPDLCETICRCMQRGTSRLVLHTNRDELLEGWEDLIPATLKPNGGVRVNATEFKFTAQFRGLCR